MCFYPVLQASCIPACCRLGFLWTDILKTVASSFSCLFNVVVPGILTFPRIPWVHLSCVWNITGEGCHLIFNTETQVIHCSFLSFSFLTEKNETRTSKTFANCGHESIQDISSAQQTRHHYLGFHTSCQEHCGQWRFTTQIISILKIYSYKTDISKWPHVRMFEFKSACCVETRLHQSRHWLDRLQYTDISAIQKHFRGHFAVTLVFPPLSPTLLCMHSHYGPATHW